MARLKLRLASILITTLALATQAWAFTGIVSSVHDGDTVTVGRTRIRLNGIDAPELDQPGGKASRDYLAGLVLGRSVEIIPKDMDTYGRTVAVILLPDGRSVNSAMVAAGQAWVYRHYCRSCYGMRAEESLARLKGLGLWSESRPIPPWVWRKNQRRH